MVAAGAAEGQQPAGLRAHVVLEERRLRVARVAVDAVEHAQQLREEPRARESVAAWFRYLYSGASALRYDFARAETSGTTDIAKATEGARLEALRVNSACHGFQREPQVGFAVIQAPPF